MYSFFIFYLSIYIYLLLILPIYLFNNLYRYVFIHRSTSIYFCIYRSTHSLSINPPIYLHIRISAHLSKNQSTHSDIYYLSIGLLVIVMSACSSWPLVLSRVEGVFIEWHLATPGLCITLPPASPLPSLAPWPSASQYQEVKVRLVYHFRLLFLSFSLCC